MVLYLKLFLSVLQRVYLWVDTYQWKLQIKKHFGDNIKNSGVLSEMFSSLGGSECTIGIILGL